MELDIDEFNKKISNPTSNLNALKGFEIIAESLVYKIYDIFGRNSLLSMLYQVGKAPGEIIAKRIKNEHNKEDFEVLEALEILMNELKDFYSLKVRKIEEKDNLIKLIVENRCFLRESTKNREKLKPGKAFCRVNKGYFETAFKILIPKVKKIEINFLENDEEKDVCVEEFNFYL